MKLLLNTKKIISSVFRPQLVGKLVVVAAATLPAQAFANNPLANIDQSTFSALRSAAPTLSSDALRHALKAARCAAASGEVNSSLVTVIDYSKPSSKRRMWVLDVEQNSVVFNEWVAHGVNSGNATADRFSNRNESRKSSLGVFRTAETYSGKHGYSLKLDGLDGRFNSNARKRAIVIHGADYVDVAQAKRVGRIGRSWGCPALRKSVSSEVINTIKKGSLLVSYYPDRDWQYASAFLNCPTARLPESRRRSYSNPTLQIVQGDTKPPQLHILSPVLKTNVGSDLLALSGPRQMMQLAAANNPRAAQIVAASAVSQSSPEIVVAMASSVEPEILIPISITQTDIVATVTTQPVSLRASSVSVDVASDVLQPVTLATAPLPIAKPSRKTAEQRRSERRSRFTGNNGLALGNFSFLQ